MDDRQLVVMADGPDGPLPDPRVVARIAGLTRPEVLLGWVVRAPGWLEATDTPVTTLLANQGLRHAVEAGRVRAVAARLSAVPALLAGRYRPAVAVVGAHEEGSGWRLAGSPGWALEAARQAQAVVIERWPGPGPAGAPLVPGEVVGVVEREVPRDPPPEDRASREHSLIGSHVAGLIPQGATIQWGPGAVAAAVLEAVAAPVRVRSGLVTDGLLTLRDRGLLDGLPESAYFWGGAPLRDAAYTGEVRLVPVARSHDVTSLSSTPRFVAVNTALQVGLDGAANVEVAGGRIVSGPGGHPDFAAGASRSRGGLSVVALPSTAGGRSTIVVRPEVTSTPRFDVDLVVTEHGIADLRGLSDRERSDRLIAIADPAHRDGLRDAG